MMHKEKATTTQIDERTAEKVFTAGAWHNIAATEQYLSSDETSFMRAIRLYPRLLQRDLLAEYERRKLQYNGTPQALGELGRVFGCILSLETFSARDQVPEELQSEVNELSQLTIKNEFDALWCWLSERLS